MPINKRRKSGHGERNDRDIEVKRRMPIEPGDGENDDKNGKEQFVTDPTIPSQDRRTASKTGNKEPAANVSNKGQERRPTSIGTTTRSRVVKRPKRDLSPPESPVKKAAPAGTKSNTPEAKTKRHWGLWSLKDKDAFFEGLFEFGKDFDAIQSLIAQKCKKKGMAQSLIKNKDQVRHFYYRTWHKIAKYIRIDSDVKKESLELYGLINYGVLRKKIKGLNEKDGQKLGELVQNGYTIVKVRGKNVRIKTPMCNALKKLNNIEEAKDEPGEKVPEKIHVEFYPKNNAAWAHVQEMSQNPRLKMILKPDRKLASVINFLTRKWKPHNLKLRESLDGDSESYKQLVVYPSRECDVTPVSLNAVHEPRIQLAFSNYKEYLLSSPTLSKGKKDKNHCDIYVDVAGSENVNVICDSPKTGKGQSKDGRTRNPSISMDISAMVEGDNAMFPDNLLSSTEESDKQTEPGSEGSSSDRICDSAINLNNGDIVMERGGHESSGCDSDKTLDSEGDDPQTVKLKDVIEHGWTANRAENLTIAELYLMFGKDEKLKLEYDWCTDDSDLANQLTNMLRRLVNLATLEFTDFCKSSPSANSPCHTCGAVKGAKNATCKNATGVKGQKANNRSPLSSKFGGSETHSDASTQTSIESSSQSKEAVFRVPVAGASFLQQRNVPTSISNIPNATRQVISQADLFVRPSDRHGKKIRSVRSNVQRRLLPKALPSRQMLTLIPASPTSPTVIRSPSGQLQTIISSPRGNNIRMASQVQQTIIGHPIGIPVTVNNRVIPTTTSINAINVPITSTTGGDNSVSLSSLTGLSMDDSSQSKSQDILAILNIQTSRDSGSNVLQNDLIGNASVDISKFSGGMSEVSNSNPGSLSPPNISSLLDLSLSNLPAGSSESSDKFIDIALGNSNSSFATLYEGSGSKELSLDPSLLTPPIRNKMEPLSLQSSPPQSPSRWLNGEMDAGDISLSTFLTESPLKSESITSLSVSTTSLMQGPLFSESSRDSIMGRLDVDATLQCMLNENSMDYANKFADLAAHITSEPVSKNS